MDIKELVLNAVESGAISTAAGENVVIELETLRDMGEVPDSLAQTVLNDYVPLSFTYTIFKCFYWSSGVATRLCVRSVDRNTKFQPIPVLALPELLFAPFAHFLS